MEKLRQYLDGRKKAEFAASIGTTPSYLSQLLSGNRKPGRKMMAAISEATNGEVDANSWLCDAPAREAS